MARLDTHRPALSPRERESLRQTLLRVRYAPRQELAENFAFAQSEVRELCSAGTLTWEAGMRLFAVIYQAYGLACEEAQEAGKGEKKAA